MAGQDCAGPRVSQLEDAIRNWRDSYETVDDGRFVLVPLSQIEELVGEKR